MSLLFNMNIFNQNNALLKKIGHASFPACPTNTLICSSIIYGIAQMTSLKGILSDISFPDSSFNGIGVVQIRPSVDVE